MLMSSEILLGAAILELRMCLNRSQPRDQNTELRKIFKIDFRGSDEIAKSDQHETILNVRYL